MNTKYLMLGNYLKWKDNGSIFELTLELFCDMNFQNHLLIGDIISIPLTEEIMVKCGFEKANTTGLYGTNINGLRYCFDFGTGSVYLDYKEYEITKDIKHLHELQNLFKSLKKQELKIEL